MHCYRHSKSCIDSTAITGTLKLPMEDEDKI